MPIKNIKGQKITHGNGIPVVARARKGESQEDAAARAKKEGKTRFTPNDLEYFRLEPETALPPTVGDANVIGAALEQLYGKKPAVIHGVHFLADNPDVVFQTGYERWVTTKNGHSVCTQRCDGEHIYHQNDMKGGIDRAKYPCRCDWQDLNQDKCGITGRLFFWLPQLTQLTGILGQVMLTTHGAIDIRNILETLNDVREKVGQLREISFTLYRRPFATTAPNGFPVVKSVVYLSVDHVAAQRIAARAVEDALSLTSGNGHTSKPLALNAGTNEAPPDVTLADEVAYPDSIKTFDQMCIVEAKDGRRMYWFKTFEDAQFKTPDTALVEDAIPLAGMPIGEWLDVELGGRVDGDKVIRLWVEVE